MKRILSTLLLSCAALTAQAQESGMYPEYQISFSWGLPGYEWMEYGDPFFLKTEELPLKYWSPIINMYRDSYGPVWSTGTFGGGFSVHFSRWFTLAIDAAVNLTWRNYHDSVTGTRTDTAVGFMVHVLPQARFYWLNRDAVRMYSSIGIGGMAGMDMYSKEFQIWPAGQVSPAGIEIGRSLFGFLEAGIGTMFAGAKAGIGYRF